MKTAEMREKFILLRAAGYSFRKIAAELGISTSTAQDWENKHYKEIKQLKADEMTALYEQYHATQRERIKTIGETLTAIEKVMKEKDVYNNLKPRDLMNYHLRYLQLLAAEYKPQDPESYSLSAMMSDFSL